MLLQLAHIQSAMMLDAAGVTFALRSNYPTDIVKTAEFVGMTANGSFVYFCTYDDDIQGPDATCTVYVHYNSMNKLVADY